MKRRLIIFFIIFFTALTIIEGYVLSLYRYESPTPYNLTIGKGDLPSKIARRLASDGIISSSRLFLFSLRFRGLDKNIKSGEYGFDRGARLKDILDTLTSGNVLLRTITIPEGLDKTQTFQLLLRAGVSIDTELINDTGFLTELFDTPIPTGLEGYLFPETYRVRSDITFKELVRLMVSSSLKVYKELERKNKTPIKMDRHEIFTLASIIEKETSLNSEKPVVASVYYNRMIKHWKLEADPTVQYALGVHHKRLFYKHLLVDSPYNTYRYAGLPPGPISSPGLSSLKATLYPASTAYYYFVADNKGGHIFSATRKEHLINQSQSQKRR